MWNPLRKIAERRSERRVRRMQTGAPSVEAAAESGNTLWMSGRFEDADAVLEAALVTWPGNADLLEQYAFVTHADGRAAIAVHRWERARDAAPDRPMPWCGLAANLRILGDLSGAETAIREGLRRFPNDLGVAGEAARVLDYLGQFAESAVQWRRLMDLVPVHQDWYQGYAYSLILLGRFEEAEAILDRARETYPDDRDLLATRGYLEMGRENWNAALAIWRLYRARFPDDQAGWQGQGRTMAAIHHARSEEEPHDTDVLQVHIETVDDDATRSLMLGFESIGTDCEFGLVQRRFGAEPLGLLRFNNVQLQKLMVALEAGFERMGDPDLTSLTVSISGEYYATDLRWDLGMHTFMFASQYDAATLLPKMCRRVVYLREKLLGDLRAAEKIFVYKGDAIDLDGLRALHERLQVYGPVRLLHVRQVSVPLSDEPVDVAPGQTYLLGPDLYVGFLSRMGNATLDWDIAFEEWVSICANIANAPPLPMAAPMADALP